MAGWQRIHEDVNKKRKNIKGVAKKDKEFTKSLCNSEVFLAKIDGGENPTMAILANTYYFLNYCCERKGGVSDIAPFYYTYGSQLIYSIARARPPAQSKISSGAG
ncbi:hypothetical protein CR513_27910, partial [Mucuna pruriens]